MECHRSWTDYRLHDSVVQILTHSNDINIQHTEATGKHMASMTPCYCVELCSSDPCMRSTTGREEAKNVSRLKLPGPGKTPAHVEEVRATENRHNHMATNKSHALNELLTTLINHS